MTQDLNSLVGEIERIVTAPYIPSLQDLYKLVQNDSRSVIKCWAIQKPCQIGLLADALVEGLSRSRIALPLLATFANEIVFRDAVLFRHPAVFDVFLGKAVDGPESDFQLACVSFLSHPFPKEIVAPARVADLITTLVSTMAKNPCAETIMPLHTLMGGLQGCSLLQLEVPDEVMSNLQVEFTKTLRNLDDHMGVLLCLATFARIASIQSHDINNKHGPKIPFWLSSIRHFFGAKRGLKTLDLVALRVILACSSNCNNLTPPQAAQSVRLAIHIAENIEPEQKEEWISANPSKVTKLCEKVARDGLDREIHMMGTAFIFGLRPVAHLPCHIREMGLHALVSKGSRGTMGVMPPHLIRHMAKSLACSEESAIYHLLRFTFETVQEGNLPNKNSLSDLKLSNLILEGFQASQSPALTSALLDSVSTKENIFKLLANFPVKTSQNQCQGEAACNSTKVALQNTVLVNLFEIYFAAELSRNGSNKEIAVMKTFVDRALMSHTDCQCSFTISTSNGFRHSTFLRSNNDFTTPQLPARDWRSGVADLLTRNSNHCHDNMMKKIEEACVDLERRCYDVEGPLRSAEEQRDRQTFEFKQLNVYKEDLERQLEESSANTCDLQQSLARLEEHADITCARMEEMSASLDLARQELESQRLHFENTLQDERETARGRELELIATCTEKDDQLEEQQERLYNVQNEKQQVVEALQRASKDQEASSETSVSLKTELAELKQQFEATKALFLEKENEVQRLSVENDEMQMAMDHMKATMEGQSTETDKLHLALQETEEKYQLDMTTAKDEYEQEISAVKSEVLYQKEEVSRLHTTMQAAACDASKDLQSKEKKINHLERKIQSLRDERAAKAREFSEAQQHIGKLMNVMGFTTNQPKSPTLQESPQKSPVKTQRRSIRQSHVYENTQTQLDESFSDMRGPTPKRPRANRNTTSPNGRESPSSADSAPRQVLGTVDTNSPNKAKLTQLPKGTQPGDENHLQAIDLDMDLEFSKDFLFSSTAFSGSNDQVAS